MPRRCCCLSLVFCLLVSLSAEPPALVIPKGPATLALEGDRLENRLLSLRLSSPLKLIVTVEGGEGLTVEGFKAEIDRQAWQLLRPEKAASIVRTPAGRYQWRKELALDPIKPGKVAVPAVSLRYREGVAAWQSVKWSGVEVEVVGPEDGDANEVRGIPPIETLPWKPPWWYPFIPLFVGMVNLALGVLLAWWWMRRRARPAPVVAPEQKALCELGLLEQSQPPAGAAADWYHTRLSEIVRRYLEERFGFRASRQTTQEFLQDVQQRPELGDAERQLLRDFLSRCDLAKFTGLSPAPSEHAEAIALARQLVLQTTPPKQ